MYNIHRVKGTHFHTYEYVGERIKAKPEVSLEASLGAGTQGVTRSASGISRDQGSRIALGFRPKRSRLRRMVSLHWNEPSSSDAMDFHPIGKDPFSSLSIFHESFGTAGFSRASGKAGATEIKLILHESFQAKASTHTHTADNYLRMDSLSCNPPPTV